MKKLIPSFIIAFTDILSLIIIFFLAVDIRIKLEQFGLPIFKIIDLSQFIFVILILFILMFYEKIYIIRYDFWQDIYKVLKATFLGYLLTLSLLTLTQTNLEYSRIFLTIYFLLVAILLPIFKRYSKKIIFYFDYCKKSTLIVGDATKMEIVKKELQDNWYLGMIYKEINYNTVIIISKNIPKDKLNSLVETYLHNYSEVFVMPYLSDINFIHSNILEYSNIRHNTIQIENKLLNKKNIFIKNSFDKIISILILPFFIPLHFCILLLIKLDSKGSAMFVQKRLGKDDKDFFVYKYRTMYTNGDKILETYLKNNPNELEYYNKYHKYQNDPRVTKIGKILRATSLDELPQILNILKGEMSLVGPRPYMLSEATKLKDNKKYILKVKPGITGLWQVSGRNNLTFSQRNQLEIWYIKNWSLWADIVILIKTIKVVLNKVGAK